MASKTKRARAAPAPPQANAKEAPRLSELENAVLGVFWRRGPCSAYVVQNNFTPISAGWSASPGSVYPLIKKLYRAKLIVAAEKEKRGARTVQRFQLTASGEAALRRWLMEVPDWAALPPADATRTRSFFLDALNAPARAAFLSNAEANTRAALAKFKADTDALDPESYEYLGRLGGVHQLEARLRWLKDLQKRLG